MINLLHPLEVPLIADKDCLKFPNYSVHIYPEQDSSAHGLEVEVAPSRKYKVELYDGTKILETAHS